MALLSLFLAGYDANGYAQLGEKVLMSGADVRNSLLRRIEGLGHLGDCGVYLGVVRLQSVRDQGI
jgi:hypothetical protein